jgi:hypothetical protein
MEKRDAFAFSVAFLFVYKMEWVSLYRAIRALAFRDQLVFQR